MASDVGRLIDRQMNRLLHFGNAGSQTPAAPVITGLPVISGSPQVGQILSASTPAISGVPYPSITWQWKRDAADIPNATSNTYTAQLADVGADLAATVTATNSEGSDTATSLSIDVSE